MIVVLAILIAINYIAGRQFKRWDLTSNQQFTLSEQTTKILKSLKEPLTMIAFERTEAMAPFRDRLQDYAAASSQVKTEFIDPDKEPLVARNMKSRPTARSRSSTRGASARHGPGRVGADQRDHQGHFRFAEEDLLRAGPRRTRHGERRRAARL